MTAPAEPGTKAPDFSLPADDRTTVTLSALAGRKVVVYFYPKDDTPGCTVEAQGFRDAAGAFENAGAVVLGISRDSVAAHCRFRDKHGLNFRLLSDPDRVALRAFGAWGEKKLYGKVSEGIIRSTFLIDASGTIRRAWRSVKVKGHVDEVLAAAQAL